MIEIGEALLTAAKANWRSAGLTMLMALALACAPRAARAQRTLEIAPPAPQAQPSLRPQPAPTARPPAEPPAQQLQVIPPAPTPAPVPQAESTPPSPPSPPPNATLHAQPVLPAVFRGCWQGYVSYLDSIQREYGAPKLGYWTPKTYRICYRRVGNGPFELTFSQVGVQPDAKITNPTGRMDLISTDRRNTARMRAQLHFDEYYPGPFFKGHTFAVDEETILDCAIQGSGAMLVRGAVFGRRDGSPWFRATWHAVFERLAGLPE